MSRCQHCNKLTHSEHLIVYYDPIDHEKVHELSSLQNWTSSYMYMHGDPYFCPNEFGKLKCGDIYVHFRFKSDPKDSVNG
jgi:hypothetical protein